MVGGDGKEAIFWAKKAEFYQHSDLKDVVYSLLAYAYELDGQYDIALCYTLLD